jgi:hypothetical protein
MESISVLVFVSPFTVIFKATMLGVNGVKRE